MKKEHEELPPWQRCEYALQEGSMVIYVDPHCRHLHMIKGKLVASKSDCRQCEHIKEKV